jgi:predicted nucleotidyltransferase
MKLMASQSDIQSLADNIVREFQPEKIILFGSHARGDAKPDSDVDLLVIMPRNGKEHHQQASGDSFEMSSRISNRHPGAYAGRI